MSERTIPYVMSDDSTSTDGLYIMVSLMMMIAQLYGDVTVEQACTALSMTRKQYTDRLQYARVYGQRFSMHENGEYDTES